MTAKQNHVLYEVIWRNRNVTAVMYWTALPNSEISQANLEELAGAQEALISADLASYQPHLISAAVDRGSGA